MCHRYIPITDNTQNKEANRDEKRRPGAEVDEIGMIGHNPEGAADDEAQEERHAPGQADKDRRPPPGMQCIILARPDSPPQFVKGPRCEARYSLMPRLASSPTISIMVFLRPPRDSRGLKS
jgi:hypothetical protein